MASPAELAETVSAVTGTPLATVVDIDRRLSQQGLRTKAGRGLSAARMTARDAAHLLIAILGAPQSNRAAEAVQRYKNTTIDTERVSREPFKGIKEVAALAALPALHSFADALSSLIESTATGALASLIEALDGKSLPEIRVYAFSRATRASIRVAGLSAGKVAYAEYAPSTVMSRGRRAKPPDAPDGDLEQSRRITEQTIIAVAKLLRGTP